MVPEPPWISPKLTVASAPSAAVTQKRRGGCSRARATATSAVAAGSSAIITAPWLADAVDSAYVVIIGKPSTTPAATTSSPLQTMADGLPALGIVAAVLGVVKTMGSIDQPPSVLGGMIGSALVGTFLGVLLAYGMVAPMAGRLKQIIEADEQIFHAVKQVVIASLHGWPQPLVVESARSGLGHDFRPGLSELLDALRGR